MSEEITENSLQQYEDISSHLHSAALREIVLGPPRALRGSSQQPIQVQGQIARPPGGVLVYGLGHTGLNGEGALRNGSEVPVDVANALQCPDTPPTD